jgi:hypothetical protein
MTARREAVARAAAEVKALEPKALETIDASVQGIFELMRAGGGAPAYNARREMHALASTVAGLGGAFGREALSKAAYSFCCFIDEAQTGWNDESAWLHWQAMRLLCTPSAVPENLQSRIIEGLVKIRLRLAAIGKSLQ